jgi:diphthine synthase
LYAFGQTISMVFFTDTWKPDSFYGRVKDNNGLGLHTLVLLDIKVKEPNLEALARGRIVYEAPRFMTAAQCAQQMVEIEELRKEDVCGKDKLAVSVARLGSDGEKIVAGTLEELSSVDMGAPLHSLVLCGTNMHEMEWEYIREFAVNQDKFDEIWKRDYAGKQH